MKFKTFVAIYYLHRIKKASFIKKIYIFFLLPFVYLVNKLFFPKIKNLDYYSLKNNYLFTKDLKFLFQFFNSDKGEFFYNLLFVVLFGFWVLIGKGVLPFVDNLLSAVLFVLFSTPMVL